jgi:hypothetical protein
MRQHLRRGVLCQNVTHPEYLEFEFVCESILISDKGTREVC